MGITYVIFGLLCGVSLAAVVWGLARRGRIYEYPFWAGVVFLLWACPQLYGICAANNVPGEMIDRVLIMALLCLGMCFLGCRAGTRPLKSFGWNFSYKRLLVSSICFTLVGVVACLMIRSLDLDAGFGTMSGRATMYLFFSRTLNLGFGIACLLLLRRFSMAAVGVVIVGTLVNLDSIVFQGKRGYALQFAFIVLLAVWFVRRKSVSRIFLICLIAVGTVFSYNVNDYRQAMAGGSILFSGKHANLAALGGIDVKGSMHRTLSEGGSEMATAMYRMAGTEALGAYDFGLVHWNALVFEYVPAQLVGRGVKNALMIDWATYVSSGGAAQQSFGYENGKGVTPSGLTDCFSSFWYFGCIKFFLIAYVMRRLYLSGLQGNFAWQLVYGLMLSNALEAITHNTSWFLSPWVYLAFFLLPALLWSRVRATDPASDIIAVPNVSHSFATRRGGAGLFRRRPRLTAGNRRRRGLGLVPRQGSALGFGKIGITHATTSIRK
jgi:hypothetical protein